MFILFHSEIRHFCYQFLIMIEIDRLKSKEFMEHTVVSQWMGEMQFNAEVNGHTVIMDAPERAGGNDRGPIPKPFVLTALSGCTGMDVVSILYKRGIELQDFYIIVTGKISKRHPIEYIAAHVKYNLKGNDKDKEAVIEAVNRSQNVLCGVSSMMKKAMPITWSIVYNEIEVFNNA